MAIWLGQYLFDGPYPDVSRLEEKPGIYVVLENFWGLISVIYIDGDENIRQNAEQTSKSRDWKPIVGGDICYAVYYTPYHAPQYRKQIESLVKEQLSKSVF